MKIMHILNTGEYSGAENIAISIIKDMNMLGHECVYVSPDGSINERLKNEGIKHLSIKSMKIKELKKTIKSFKPDIIHAHDFRASITTALTLTNKPIISHIHHNPPWIKEYGLKSLAYLFSSFRYKKILIVSKAIQTEYAFSKFIYKKMIIIKNFINEMSVKEKALEKLEYNKQYDIIFLGRLVEQKDPLRCIKIIKRVKQKVKNVSAVIVGDGELRQTVENMVKSNELNNHIDVLGFRQNPYPILNSSKILCMTSKFEGYGLVAVEALTLCKPVVATGTGGIPTIIDESCGKICENDNEFVEEIIKLLNDKEYYKQKSDNTILRLHKVNNKDEYINNLQKIYYSIIT